MTASSKYSEVVDPITQQVIRNSLIAAVDEMRTTMVQTSFNPVLYEVQDFAVALLSPEGDIMAQGSSLPLFIACFPSMIQYGVSKFGLSGFKEGDIIIANDPYTTGTHISDTAIYIPIFCDGELQAFSVNMAHWADVGGQSAGGWCPESTHVLNEGRVFTHLKLSDGGQTNEALMELILSNVRFPDLVQGDLNAQIAACQTGRKRYLAQARKHGAKRVRQAINQVMDQSEAHVRRLISEIPDGEWRVESCLDHDGVIKDRPRKICVTVRIAGDEAMVDLTGTDETAVGPVNTPLPAARGAIELAFKSVTVPNEPSNSGHMRALKVTSPKNTMTNPSWPAPCDSYGYVCLILTDLVSEALSNAIPDRCPSAEYMLLGTRLFRLDPRFGKPFIVLSPQCGGGGALPFDDGPDGVIFHGDGDAPNTPAEITEARFPVLIDRYELHTQEYGIGKYRGGLGTIRDYRVLTDNVSIQMNNERTLCRPRGLFGGSETGINRLWINPGTTQEQSLEQRVSALGPFHEGTLISARTAGGAGWGNPLERDPERVRQEVLNEILTAEDAEAWYGVVVGFDDLEPVVDLTATKALRQRRKQ